MYNIESAVSPNEPNCIGTTYGTFEEPVCLTKLCVRRTCVSDESVYLIDPNSYENQKLCRQFMLIADLFKPKSD